MRIGFSDASPTAYDSRSELLLPRGSARSAGRAGDRRRVAWIPAARPSLAPLLLSGECASAPASSASSLQPREGDVACSVMHCSPHVTCAPRRCKRSVRCGQAAVIPPELSGHAELSWGRRERRSRPFRCQGNARQVSPCCRPRVSSRSETARKDVGRQGHHLITDSSREEDRFQRRQRCRWTTVSRRGARAGETALRGVGIRRAAVRGVYWGMVCAVLGMSRVGDGWSSRRRSWWAPRLSRRRGLVRLGRRRCRPGFATRSC